MSTLRVIRCSLLMGLCFWLPAHARADAPDDQAAAEDEPPAPEDEPPAPEDAAPAPEDAAPAPGDAAPAAAPPRISEKKLRARRKEAKKLFKDGMRHIDKQRHGEAIQVFLAAYELDPQPEHLFNLGVAHHLQAAEHAAVDDIRGARDDREKAIDFYRKYLGTKPDQRLVAQTEQYIQDLTRELKVMQELLAAQDARLAAEKELASARQAMADAEAEREQARRAIARERQAIEERVAGAERERDRWRDAATTRGSSAGAGKRVLGSTLLIAGGAALGAAVIYGLDARSAQSELDGLGEGDEWTVSRDWLHERGQQSERRMMIVSITGAVLIAGGATVYYLGERDARKPRLEGTGVAIAPALGPTGASVQVSGSF